MSDLAQSDWWWPVFAMMALTFLVWCLMYWRRLGEIRRLGLSPEQVSTPADLDRKLSDSAQAASNHLKNLFELPLFFYLLCLFFAEQGGGVLDYRLAWGYVFLRVLHALAQCFGNFVPLRFAAYMLSSLLLWALLVRAVMLL